MIAATRACPICHHHWNFMGNSPDYCRGCFRKFKADKLWTIPALPVHLRTHVHVPACSQCRDELTRRFLEGTLRE